MSQVKESLEQLVKAVEKIETLVEEGHIVNSQQQDLFASQEQSARRTKTPANQSNSNVHVLNARDLEHKLNSVIGKMETLIKEG